MGSQRTEGRLGGGRLRDSKSQTDDPIFTALGAILYRWRQCGLELEGSGL